MFVDIYVYSLITTCVVP